MNKEQQQIIDVVYANHSKEYEKDNSIGISRAFALIDGTRFYRKIDKETFIALCTCDEAFSEQWGLKIEERELSLLERVHWTIVNKPEQLGEYNYLGGDGKGIVITDFTGIPTKLIIVTYNNTKIESYEK
jgi:hypothetical protein